MSVSPPPASVSVRTTGSASTAAKLRNHPSIVRESVRFVAEQDSLNASVLGPDAAADSRTMRAVAVEAAAMTPEVARRVADTAARTIERRLQR